jgi:hypothetical protein
VTCRRAGPGDPPAVLTLPEGGPVMGRHSKPQGRRTAQRRTIATVELVDVTGTAHRVTVDAAADGLPRGRYATVCGGDVLPAALVARAARFCRLCAPIPSQRSR